MRLRGQRVEHDPAVGAFHDCSHERARVEGERPAELRQQPVDVRPAQTGTGRRRSVAAGAARGDDEAAGDEVGQPLRLAGDTGQRTELGGRSSVDG